MGFDWVFSNWELYLGIGVALAIALFILFKQEFESFRGREKADNEAVKQGNPKKNMRTKKTAGGGTVSPAGTSKKEKNPKDSI